MAYLLSRLFQKLQSWFQLPDGNWELAKILTTSGTELVISLSDEKVSSLMLILSIYLNLTGTLCILIIFQLLGSKGEWWYSDTCKSWYPWWCWWSYAIKLSKWAISFTQSSVQIWPGYDICKHKHAFSCLSIILILTLVVYLIMMWPCTY